MDREDAEGRLPECWIPPSQILECRALLEPHHDLRAEHAAWVQRIHAVAEGCQFPVDPPERCGVGCVAADKLSRTTVLNCMS